MDHAGFHRKENCPLDELSSTRTAVAAPADDHHHPSTTASLFSGEHFHGDDGRTWGNGAVPAPGVQRRRRRAVEEDGAAGVASTPARPGPSHVVDDGLDGVVAGARMPM